ncbi:MAG: AAA family ATPase [Lachnospiraceae bacterium]|jgi:AAA+ ATPase superfamily predicted ATPase
MGEQRFFGRDKEMKDLQECYETGRFELVRVSGAKGTGKRTLVRRFAKQYGNAVYWYSPAGLRADEDLQAIGRCIEGKADAFPDMETAFRQMFIGSSRVRLIFVIDNCRLFRSRSGLVDMLHQLIRDYKKTCHLMLILIDEDMEGLFEFAKTKDIELGDLPVEHAMKLLSDFSPEDRAILYMVIGTRPGRLVELDPKLSARDNIREKVASPGSDLYFDPRLHLSDIMRARDSYLPQLYAIATARTSSMKDISDAAGWPPATVNSNMNRLMEMKLVEKHYPFGEDPETTNRTRYRFPDPMMRFYFTNLIYYERKEPEKIMAGLNAYLEKRFPDLAADYLRFRFGGEYGIWWNFKYDIPVAGRDGDGKSLIAFTRWNGDVAKGEDLNMVRRVRRSRNSDRCFLIYKPGYTFECVRRSPKIDDRVELVRFDYMMEDLEKEEGFRKD